MWTVYGKAILSIFFIFLVKAFSAPKIQFSKFDPNVKCIESFLENFDEFENTDLESSATFRQKVEFARVASRDPFCWRRLRTAEEAAEYMRYIWREQKDFTCQFRAKDTFLSDATAASACRTSQSHDLVSLESDSRRILILGETHVKDIIAGQYATHLLTKFAVRGVEGFSGNIENSQSGGVTYFISAFLTHLGIASYSTTYTSSEQGYFFGFDGYNDFLMINRNKVTTRDSQITNPFRFLKKSDGSSLSYPVTIALERSASIREEVEKGCPTFSACGTQKRNQLLINLRNDDMLSTTEKILKVLPKDQNLLLIMGYRHIPDFTTRLACSQGMQATFLATPHLDPHQFNTSLCQKWVSR